MIAIGRIGQLGIDAQPVAHLADTAFEDVCNAQLFGHLPHIGHLTLDPKRGIAGGNVKVGDFGKIGNQILGHAVGEIFLLRIAR